MLDWKEYYLFCSTFITYQEELKGCLLLESEKGVIPIELQEKNLGFITFYPNVMKKLMDGEVLYLNAFHGYLGKEKTEGPYCEQEIFVSEYDSIDRNLLELMGNLDHRIEKEKPSVKKLSKLGIYYK